MHSQRAPTLLAVLITALSFSACEHPGRHDIRKGPLHRPEASAPPAPEQPTAASEAPSTDLAEDADEPSPSVATGDDTPVTGQADRIAARHVLVSHEGAMSRPLNVHRSRAAARAKAEELQARLQGGEDFATLARRESDCASAGKGGFLGGFSRGAMTPAFEDAAFALEVGEISDIVETSFGFHIVKREALAEVHVAQVLVTWQGAASSKATRTKEEARAQAQLAYERLAAGEPFETVARELSDGAAGLRGGDLGWFTQGQFTPAWESVAFALEPGQTSSPFETNVGYHVLRRLE